MLQKISIQNFKSLKMVTLELQKVNLLIGANNSGKSNFLKALEFVSNRLSAFHDDNIADYTFNHELNDEVRIRLISRIDKNINAEQYRVFTFLHDLTKPIGKGDN